MNFYLFCLCTFLLRATRNQRDAKVPFWGIDLRYKILVVFFA